MPDDIENGLTSSVPDKPEETEKEEKEQLYHRYKKTGNRLFFFVLFLVFLSSINFFTEVFDISCGTNNEDCVIRK